MTAKHRAINIIKEQNSIPTCGDMLTRGSVTSAITKLNNMPLISRKLLVITSSCGKLSSFENAILNGIIGIKHMASITEFMKMSALLSTLNDT